MKTEKNLCILTKLEFETARLTVHHWQGDLEDQESRSNLCNTLAGVLTSQVLVELPPSLQLDGTPEEISKWIDARVQDSECFLVVDRAIGKVFGLLILVEGSQTTPVPTLHLGYLFAQNAWGQGYATELVGGLLKAVKSCAPICIIGGVSVTNSVSARVLKKLGFVEQIENSMNEVEFFSITLKPD